MHDPASPVPYPTLAARLMITRASVNLAAEPGQSHAIIFPCVQRACEVTALPSIIREAAAVYECASSVGPGGSDGDTVVITSTTCYNIDASSTLVTQGLDETGRGGSGGSGGNGSGSGGGSGGGNAGGSPIIELDNVVTAAASVVVSGIILGL